MKRIRVSLARQHDQSYDVLIGRDILERACLRLAKLDCANRFIVIADSTVAGLYGNTVVELLESMEVPAELMSFPAGESSKTMGMVMSLAAELLERKADRTTALVALGGGVTGDLVGFVASIYMRSVPCIQVPTTLVAQVDSSIGGKTGVDFDRGKNLLGAFHQPKQVIIDLAFLDTLPDEAFRSGLAEVVKYGIIDDRELFDFLEHGAAVIMERSPGEMQQIVERSCAIKKGIVEIDLRDTGLRRILNFGHTVGHALEAASDYRISHGSAVAIGMAVEARIAEKKGYLATAERERIERLLDAMHLERTVPGSLDTNDIVERIGVDKKKAGTSVPFVLIKRIGVPFINGSIDGRLVTEAIEDIRA